jgi:YaiO family outer membrane protein
MPRFIVLSLVTMLVAGAALAQEDTVTRARTLAHSGQHQAALQLLEPHLQQHPNDHDARTLYGTVLSWTGDYARARTELQRVLAAEPANADARAALANVEQWSRRLPDPTREAMIGIDYEEAAEDDWLQLHAGLRAGLLIARLWHGERDGARDQQAEVELYPRVSRDSYAYLTAAVSTESVLYPEWRVGAEYYANVGRGFEASLGYRRLQFDDGIDLFTGSLGKYAGNWLFQGRVYRADVDTSWQASARRYVGDRGGYVGLRYGVTRDEIRTGTDLLAFDEPQLGVEGRMVTATRWTWTARAGVSRPRGDERVLASVTLCRQF